jgi:phosphatidylcholine synthase
MLRPMSVLAAWLVHAYTASSAALGLWSIVACFHGQLRLSMGLMLLCLVIDSTDGALARALRVRERVPQLDGRRLDDICDYLTYVVAPACFLIEAERVPHAAWAALPVLASAYGFSRVDAKTDDHFFLGFPSYWNVVAIYLQLLQVPPALGAALVVLFAGLVFVPLRYVYPSRTRFLRPLTVAVLGSWTVGFAWLALHPRPPTGALVVSALGPLYYFGLSIALQLRSARAKLAR